MQIADGGSKRTTRAGAARADEGSMRARTAWRANAAPPVTSAVTAQDVPSNTGVVHAGHAGTTTTSKRRPRQSANAAQAPAARQHSHDAEDTKAATQSPAAQRCRHLESNALGATAPKRPNPHGSLKVFPIHVNRGITITALCARCSPVTVHLFMLTLMLTLTHGPLPHTLYLTPRPDLSLPAYSGTPAPHKHAIVT